MRTRGRNSAQKPAHTEEFGHLFFDAHHHITMAPLDGTKTPPTQNITTIGTIGGMNNNILHPNVEDKVATGTEAILHSPHISDGPGRIANAPVPSVYNDDRGTIDRLRVGGKRINLLYSQPNVMRSGYCHPETKYDFVISGQVEVWLLTPQGTDKTIYPPGESFEIPPYTPHILHFLSHTVLAEWWEQPGESRCWLYHPYRNIVDVQNSLLSTSTGQHQLLVPQNDFDRQQDPATGMKSLFLVSTGIVIGVMIGSLLARPSR